MKFASPAALIHFIWFATAVMYADAAPAKISSRDIVPVDASAFETWELMLVNLNEEAVEKREKKVVCRKCGGDHFVRHDFKLLDLLSLIGSFFIRPLDVRICAVILMLVHLRPRN